MSHFVHVALRVDVVFVVLFVVLRALSSELCGQAVESLYSTCRFNGSVGRLDTTSYSNGRVVRSGHAGGHRQRNRLVKVGAALPPSCFGGTRAT